MRSLFSNTVTVWPGAVELLGGGEARRARADDGDRAPGAALGPLARSSPRRSRGGDLPLDLLDGDGLLVDAEHARLLARRRAERGP